MLPRSKVAQGVPGTREVRAQQAKPRVGSPVKLKSLLFSLVVSLAAIAAARSTDSNPAAQAQTAQTQLGQKKNDQTQINQTQIIAWLTAGMPSYRVAQLVQQRGLASAPTQDQL